MQIVGCDFHPEWQQVAVFDVETGELTERRLVDGDGEEERFYWGLAVPALVGVEACGNSQWFLKNGLQHLALNRGLQQKSRLQAAGLNERSRIQH